jgi:hypothetical protein
MDSYSLIDLTGKVPLVSFATKSDSRFECVVPMVSLVDSEPTTTHSHL